MIGRPHRCKRLLLLLALALPACQADVWVETPDERQAARADTVTADTARAERAALRPTPIDSAAASFAWVVDRPAPRVPSTRPFPDNAVEAARQFLRALAQTGSSSRGAIGVGGAGYDRAFTYVHPATRGGRTAEGWASRLAGIVRPTVVQLEALPDDSTRVFAEVLVLWDVNGQSLLGVYYGHFTAFPGDNGWQLTGARLASEDWQSTLGGHQPWRWDRAGAAQAYAAEDPSYALDLIELESGEWVPRARPAPTADLMFGLPVPR